MPRTAGPTFGSMKDVQASVVALDASTIPTSFKTRIIEFELVSLKPHDLSNSLFTFGGLGFCGINSRNLRSTFGVVVYGNFGNAVCVVTRLFLALLAMCDLGGLRHKPGLVSSIGSSSHDFEAVQVFFCEDH